MEILSGGHRDGKFDEIPSFFSEICRKVAHVLGCKYKLERVKPQIFAVKICSKKLPIEGKSTILNI